MSKVFFIHRRRVLNNAIQNNGGATIAYRENEDGTVDFAFAECSIKDNFSRAVGRAKAAGRLDSTTHKYTSTGWNFEEFSKYMTGIPVHLCSYRKGGLFTGGCEPSDDEAELIQHS